MNHKGSSKESPQQLARNFLEKLVFGGVWTGWSAGQGTVSNWVCQNSLHYEVHIRNWQRDDKWDAISNIAIYLNVIASNVVVFFRTSIYMLDTFLHVISPNYTSFMHSRFAYVKNVERCLFGFHTGRAITIVYWLQEYCAELQQDVFGSWETACEAGGERWGNQHHDGNGGCWCTNSWRSHWWPSRYSRKRLDRLSILVGLWDSVTPQNWVKDFRSCFLC